MHTSTTLVRRLLALLLLCCGAVVVLGAPASAAPRCPASVSSWPEQVQRADAVFTGAVFERVRQGPGIHYTVQVERSFKGDVGEQVMVLTARNPRACGLPDLTVGETYVFLATENGGDLTISADSGTTSATPAHVAKVERILGAGTSPVVPEPEQPTFTTVGQPLSSPSRVAAPGAALVIVGLLGLVLVAALGRRRSA